MKRYRITYQQESMGKTLQDSYIKTVSSEFELHRAINALYGDPHIFNVDYERLEVE